ncbi:hypothetical protein ACI77O_12140 [Pseudomonas tritici]|uniref:hypothetical protein n=1 Tax=Pseudomonas tritici TaxID=2745518 RepID=UPI00387B8818
MLIDLRRATPGELPDDVFAELVADNSYSPEMVEALRDHLVRGMSTKEAIKKNGVISNKFKMRLDKLMLEIMKAGRIVAMLTEQTSPQAEPERQLNDPIGAAFELSRALTEQLDTLRQQQAPRITK